MTGDVFGHYELPAEPGSQLSEPPPLAVVETQALPSQPSLQDAILLLQKRDDIGLCAMEPAAQGRDQ